MKYQSAKLYAETLRILRLIYAYTGEKMVKTVDRLALQEFERIQKERKDA